MQIAVSGKFSTDHFDTGFATSIRMRELVQSAEIQAVVTALDGIVFSPVIISDEFEIEKKSHRSYSHKENAEFVNEDIDVAKWALADERGRLTLMIDAFERAVRGTRSSRLHDGRKDAIVAHVLRSAEANGS